MSLDQALKSHERGELPEAEREYRRLLNRDPGCHEALHGLGLVLHEYDRNEPAASLIKKAIEFCPDRADYHYHLGEVLRAAGRHAEAIASYREAIRLDDTGADYFFGLGNALAEQGSSTESIEAYRRAASLAPRDVEIHNNLGNALADHGDIAAALGHLREAVVLQPGYPDAHHNLAVVLKESGRTEDALEHARRACELAPERVEPLVILGQLLDTLGDQSRAAGCYREAAARSAANPALLATIADGLRSAGDPRAAINVYRTVIDREPGVTGHRVSICHCLIQLHLFQQAETESREALEIDPDCAPALGTLAVCLQTRGQFDQAAELLRRALALQPTLTEAAYLLAANGGSEMPGREFERWLSLESDGGLRPEKQAHLHFAIAKVYERRRSYDAAFRHFEQANRIKSRLYAFHASRHTDYIDRIRAVFTREFFEQRRDSGIADERPVFIVGMPRSGSTLVEQILSRHPDFAATGEHPEIREIVRDLPAILDAGSAAPECCRVLPAETSVALARRYLASLPEAATAAVRVSDKMLGNFLRLGVIALLFPRARVVHCVRNPLDTCVSCFTQDFAQGLRFTTDLSHLASFYRDYRVLMAHWRAVLPLPIMDVHYESLVSDPEQGSRALIEFCGLPWNERCSNPHLCERQIATASVWQARQPVYTSSIERWRGYETHLGPLIDGLRKAGVLDAA